MQLASDVAYTLGQARLDGRMPILKALVEFEMPRYKIRLEHIEFTLQRFRFLHVQYANPHKPLHVHPARFDVVDKELAIKNDVVAGEEAHDALIRPHAFLLPEQRVGALVDHAGSPVA